MSQFDRRFDRLISDMQRELEDRINRYIDEGFQKREIAYLRQRYRMTYKDLATMYGLSASEVRRIVKGGNNELAQQA